jgi:hypothetical protein
MNNEDKLTPTNNPSNNVPAKQGLKIGLKTGVIGDNVPKNLRQRTFEGKQKKVERLEHEVEERTNDNAQASTMLNRIGLMMDISGSMDSVANGESKIIHLQHAYTTFLECLDFNTTSLAVRTFPFSPSKREVEGLTEEEFRYGHLLYGVGVQVDLSTSPLTLVNVLPHLIPSGSTPMSTAMKHVLENVPITRGVLISDGCADDPNKARDVAKDYGEAQLPIDCVHIGNERKGEDLLKEVAETTGGIYIKFTNVENFAKSFIYLTPKYRKLLTSGALSALDIGASEVKYLGR